MISLPKEWNTYVNYIRDRCRDLITFKIWSGIDLHQLERWRQNFKTQEEKYFSACVLDSLIYRSNQQTYSLINHVLQKNLNNLFRQIRKPNFQIFPEGLTKNEIDPLVRLVPAITSFAPVTKSSNEILRFMKRHFLISEKWIINPWKIKDALKDGVEVFIFIDDFLGTGHQFEELILESSLEEVIDNNIVVYAPLTAHLNGIIYLNDAYPKLKITTAERLDKSSHSFFQNYFANELFEAKLFYTEMLKVRGIELQVENQFGYGNLELTYAFEHAAPDNSLYILHSRHPNWSPLFNR